MKIPVQYPFLYCQCKYTWDRYRSICSAIKCPLENTADDYFVTSNGEDYNATQAAYIVLQIMGYLRVPCLPRTIICLLPPVYLSVYFVHVTVCASVQLMFGSRNFASLYDGKICLFSYESGEINSQTHSWNS